MNKTEFSALPPDLQRDVKCAVACGWPLKDIALRGTDLMVYDLTAPARWVKHDWKPTTDRSVWAGLLEAFQIAVVPQVDNYEVWFAEQYAESTRHPHLPTAIVCEVIRRDPLGHLSRSGL